MAHSVQLYMGIHGFLSGETVSKSLLARESRYESRVICCIYSLTNVLGFSLYVPHYLQDASREKEKFKKRNLAELVPFLLNYLREKTSHHLTSRQNAALTPKKTPVSQTKGVKSTSDQSQHGTKNSSKGSLFPSQKTPSPSPVTPLSQSRREKLHEQYSSPSSSPRLRRKSPKVQGNDRDKLSPLVAQPKINIDDPDDFPPMGSTRYRKE